VPRQRLARHFNYAVVAVALLVGALDVVSTIWARHELAHRSLHVLGPIWLRLQSNTGVSFSISFSGPLLTTIATTVVVIVVLIIGLRARGTMATTGFGLLIGGGLANVAVRLTSSSHAVTDFIAVSTFPVFNVADVAITCGFIVLALAVLRGQPLVSR
jgi:signal peptidase II